jgi:hypothetical protein
VLLDQPTVTSGRVARTSAAGQMQFSPAGGHNHWHYLHFEDYVLLSLPDLQFVAPTRKTGFCLVGLAHSFSCGANNPNHLTIGNPAELSGGPYPATQAMGMITQATGPDRSPERSSYDSYGPSVEGQDIDITGVPDGRYCLSFTVDPEDEIVEESSANNGASRLIDIGTQGGGRTVRVGQAYENSGTCKVTDPPAGGGTNPPGGGSNPGTDPPQGGGGVVVTPRVMTSRLARKEALLALRQKFRKPKHVARTCRLTTGLRAKCRVTFRQSGARYRGAVKVAHSPRAGEWKWFYAVDAKRVRRGSCRSSRRCPRRVKTRTLLGGVLGANSAAARRALTAPPGRPAQWKPGTAWDQSRLCRLSAAQVRERKPVG